jgi:acetylornithine/N-succinyldiaminopimelate aminotransferase|tara:strand:- start:1219 stop:2403 length:1185 start_codon:yes stop_codon:yes gene_type:complete
MALSPAIMKTYGRIDIAFSYGKGSYLFSEDGKKYLDYATGIAVNSFGHSHPRLVEVLKDQSSKLWHVSNLYRIPEQEKVAQKLVDNSCADQVFFCNSGAEATEGAVKVARKHAWAKNQKERTEIICATGAFHGRTLAMLAANDRPMFREGFGPKVPGFSHVEWGDIKSLESKLNDKVAAILVEPVQGEGGARKAPSGYLKEIEKLAKRYGCLLISDEVQIGMGRSGTLFAYQQEGIEPDIIALAKGLGGGFPVGAVMAKSEVGDSMVPGTHGSTFGGNPLAMRSAEVVIDLLLENGFLENLQQKIKYLDDRIEKLIKNSTKIFVKRKGKGFLRGIELSEKIPVGDFSNLARENGLLLVGAAENTIRILPPLNTSFDEIDFAINVFEKISSSIEV